LYLQLLIERNHKGGSITFLNKTYKSAIWLALSL